MVAPVQDAKRTAHEARDSDAVEGLARLGFGGRGLMYLVVGALALQVAVGRGGEADQHGALGAIKQTPLGGVLLAVLAVAFTGYAAWRLLEAAVGHREAAGIKRTGKRLASLGRAFLYGGLAVTTVRFLLSSESHDKTKPLTARALDLPGGPFLVALVGTALVGGGLTMAYRGAARKFLKRLDLHTASGTTRTAVSWIGRVGLVGRGLVVALVGGFVTSAAITLDPADAKGVDAALKTLAQAPYGEVLLVGAAVGLLGFGAWSFVEARYRKV